MGAAFVTEQGDYDQRPYGELPEPAWGPDEVLVRVRAAGMNRRDIYERTGSHGMRIQGPQVPGLDLAGEVAEVGGYVAHTGRFKQGDRVLGVGLGGTYAEYARARMDRIQ